MPFVMDVKSTIFSYDAAEFQLGSSQMAEMAHYFELPNYGTAGTSASQAFDGQAVSEAISSILMASLSGVNLVHDIGVLFLDSKDYEPVCGHAVIGLVTTLFETGMFDSVAPETLMTLDTPAGLVRAHARVVDSRVREVSFEGVPSFVYRSDITLEVPEIGDLLVDVVFGGLFFVFVHASQIDIELLPDNAARLARHGMRIMAIANEKVAVRHPDLPHIDKIIDLRFYTGTDDDGVDSRNVVILGDHMVDRSPCGTGTCAEAALRYARGQLNLGEPFVTESIIGTRFTGRAVAETQVGSGSDVFPGVIPQVTGSAHVTGFHQFVLDNQDPFPEGFRLVA